MQNIVHNFDEYVERRGGDSWKYDPRTVASDVLPMTTADTDFYSPKPLVDAMIERAKVGHYGYVWEDPGFQKSAKRWMKVRFGWEIDETWVRFAAGVVQGMTFAVRALSHPGDKVVIQTPVYPPFHMLTENNGRRLVCNSLVLKDGRYTIDFEDLEIKLADPRVKLMLVCNPQNPTGRVFTKPELCRIGELCLKYGVITICDEIHEDIVMPGYHHTPLASISKEICDNTITFINPSKTFNIPGLHTAAAIISNAKIREEYNLQAINNKAVARNVFGDLAFMVSYNDCDYYADQLVEYLSKELKWMEEYFENNIPEIKVIHPESTYVLWLDCRNLKYGSEKDLKDMFVNEAKILPKSGVDFGDEGKGFVRINYAVPFDRLKNAIIGIEKMVQGNR